MQLLLITFQDVDRQIQLVECFTLQFQISQNDFAYGVHENNTVNGSSNPCIVPFKLPDHIPICSWL